MPKNKTSAWKAILGIVLCFVLPMSVAHLLYIHANDWGLTIVNYGHFIQPEIATKSIRLATLADQPFELADLSGRWVVMQVENQCPSDDVKKHMYHQRHIRDLLGKDRERLINLLVMPKKCKLRPLAKVMRKAYPQMKLAVFSDAQMDHLNRVLLAAGAPEIEQGGGQIYFIDPVGQISMRFDLSQNPKHIYSDLAHLLHQAA